MGIKKNCRALTFRQFRHLIKKFFILESKETSHIRKTQNAFDKRTNNILYKKCRDRVYPCPREFQGVSPDVFCMYP